jgi:hypothetical protein
LSSIKALESAVADGANGTIVASIPTIISALTEHLNIPFSPRPNIEVRYCSKPRMGF